jgi:hypothetical protein
MAPERLGLRAGVGAMNQIVGEGEEFGSAKSCD